MTAAHAPPAARVLARVIDVAAWVGGRSPAGLRRGAARVGGNIEWALRPGLRRLLAANLAHAVGAPASSATVRRAVREEIVNEARRSADLLWAMDRPGELVDSIEVVGDEHIVKPLAAGRGVVLTGVHLGGWEVAAAVPSAILPAPTSAVVSDDWLAWGIEHRRAAVGLQVIHRRRAALPAARRLRRGEVVLILGDDASGIEPRLHLVRFCDGSAWVPSGPVSLARLGRAPIVPFAVVPGTGGRWRVEIEPPIEPPLDAAGEAEVLQRVADRWTATIRAYPTHWAARFPIRWATAE